MPLNLSARKALQRWLNECPDNGTAYVFTSRAGGRLQPRTIHRRIVYYVKRAGIGDMTPHTLRHTCVRWMKVSPWTESLTTWATRLNTTRTYTRPSQSNLTREVEKIAWEGNCSAYGKKTPLDVSF
jgi:integrase/recombinase XerD